MKTNQLLVLLVALMLPTSVTTAQKPALKIMSDLNLQFDGNVGNYYLLESSTNLLNWAQENNFCLTNTRQIINTGGINKPREFFRIRFLASANNQSYPVLCAENDNVMVFLRGDINKFSVTATHPTYTVTDYTLWFDFSGYDPSHVYPSYSYTARSVKIYDGGLNNDTVLVDSDATFWRPTGMTITVNGNQNTKQENIQRLTLVRHIPNSGEWPNFLVFYCDGNMRLIPFPPVGQLLVSYGSSIIIGPTDLAHSDDGLETRPVCDIASIDYRTASKTMFITYRFGGTAVLDVNEVTRTQSVVKVSINYSTAKPFCTLRSNYVSDVKCDTSTVVWKDLQNGINTNQVMGFNGTIGKEWFFTRPTPSVTRNSSPDIRITTE